MNSPEAIKKWVEAAIGEAENLTMVQKAHLVRLGRKMADQGEWRGNISEAWMKLGYTTADIPDLYP